MPSYIEAGELLMELNDTDIFDTYNDYSMVFDTIDNFPTTDVAPVRHAKWELIDECINEGVYCSNCRKKIYRSEYANQKVKSNYCPNCGAKMDGDPYA